MKSPDINSIKKIGISQPDNKIQNYFSYFNSEDILKLPDELPNIKKIISIVVEPEVISKKAINTIKGYSSEGNYFTGKKIIVYLKLKQKILYVTNSENETIHLFINEYFDSVSIVIPPTINGSNPQKLIDYEYIKAAIYIQDIVLYKINERSIFCNIYILANVFPVSCYEIVYSITENDICSLYLCHDLGRYKKLITFINSNKNTKPKWNPNGNKIAFLVNKKAKKKYMLKVYDLKNNKINEITNLNDFSSITSFCWTADDNKIIISGINNKRKELYSINLITLDIKQLTSEKCNIKSYKPLVSPSNKQIAFLQSIYNITNLCIMDIDGMNIKKLASANSIKSFDWSNDSKNIVYIVNKIEEKDQLKVLNLPSFKNYIYNTPNEIVNIRKIKYSPDNKYLAFIGSRLTTDNIYIYSFNENKYNNLTNNVTNIHISDFDWKIDSSFIYYSSNDYQYYNIFCISLDSFNILNITNTTSSNILLNYRPKII